VTREPGVIVEDERERRHHALDRVVEDVACDQGRLALRLEPQRDVTARVADGGLALEATTEVGIGRYDVGEAAANTGPTESSWMRTLSTLVSARLHVSSGSI
jgi:hypothetical protein